MRFTMVSFHIKSFCTSASFTKTIDILLDRVSNCKEIPTALTKDGMKKSS